MKTDIDIDELSDEIVRRIGDAMLDGTWNLSTSRHVGSAIEGQVHVDSHGVREAFARRLYPFIYERHKVPKVDIDIRAGGYTAGTTVDIVVELHLY